GGGHSEVAFAFCKGGLPLGPATPPADDRDWAAPLAVFGQTLLEAGQPTAAEPLLRESLAIRETKAPDAWMTFKVKSQLGDILLGQQKYAEAEPLLLHGYEGLKQRTTTLVGTNRRYLTEAGERVVRFYEATNQPEKAKEWREKLAADKRPDGS